MQWWDDIWLNEGFATWMETKPVKSWKPEWQMEVTETESNQGAMRLDALESTRPIRTRAETPAEINELFDPIAYGKGGAVLRMIEAWVGEEAFRKGVNEYIQRFKYGNAKAQDFWSTIAASTSKPVDRVMATFVDQPGVPLLNISATCQAGHETVAVTQSRFQLEGASQTGAAPPWSVPVCVRTPSGPATCDLIDKPQQTMTLNACPGWVLPNWGGRGYYRTALDPESLKAIAGSLRRLSASERLTLLSDEWALVKAGVQSVASYLDFASSFGYEDVEQVLSALTSSLQDIESSFATAATRPAFRSWVRRTFGPAAARSGWGSQSERAEDSLRAVRAGYLLLLGGADDPEALSAARRLVDQELATPSSVDSTLLGSAIHVAAAHGDTELYDKYVARVKAASDPGDRDQFLRALSEFKDPALSRRTFDFALGPDVRSQDSSLVIAAQLANDAARDIIWTLVRERWTAVEKKSSAFGGNTIIVSALGSFCDSRHAEEVKTFFAVHPVPDAARTLSQTIETINTCATLSAAQTPKLTEWLDAQNR
jgi:aminopeptidase N